MMIFWYYVPSPTVVHTYRLVVEPEPALPRLPVAPLPPLPLLTPALPQPPCPLLLVLPLPLPLPCPRVLLDVRSSLELSPSSPEASRSPSRLEEESLPLAVASLSSMHASSSLLLLSSLFLCKCSLHFQHHYQTDSQPPGQRSNSLAMAFLHEITVDSRCRSDQNSRALLTKFIEGRYPWMSRMHDNRL